MRVIFFCGHKSPYGRAHLEPLLQSKFNVVAVILATDKRWNIFSKKLLGGNYYLRKGSIIERLKRQIKKLLKQLIPYYILKKLGIDYKKPIDVEKLLRNYKIRIYHENNILHLIFRYSNPQ